MAEEKKDIRLPPLVPSVKSPRTEVYPTPRSDISHAMSLPPVLSSVKSNDPRRPIFHSHVVYGSPLWHRDTVQTTIRPLQSPTTLRSLEGAFVNDAVKTAIFTRPRKIPIIPDYVAAEDKYARAYFKSPMVQNTMAKVSQEYVVGSPRRTMNKLSVRHRCRSTPPTEDLSNREKEFVNDAVITEKKRTKYKDIIPPYDAVKDKNARAYFMRRDIQQLIGVTRSAR